jgi:NAD(P)-dependent dehydrogenase (short-subunit alcohol dehydrogenase family)
MEEAKRLISQATARTHQRVKLAEELAAEKKASEDEEREEEELERQCEQWCGKICRIGIVIPLLYSYVMYPIGEYAMRPAMEIDTKVDLSDIHAIVTGGCSGIGLDTASLLAESGASVVLGCRDSNSEVALTALRTVKSAAVRWSQRSHGHSVRQPRVMTLRLDRLASIRTFARRYTEEVGRLRLLVNNAGTRRACSTTDDGIEVAFQANYLGHFLLTQLMMPLLRDSSSARVVHVTCRDGYLRRAHGWNQWFRDGWMKGWLGRPTPISEGVRVGTTLVETQLRSTDAEEEDGWGHELVPDGDEASADGSCAAGDADCQEPTVESRAGSARRSGPFDWRSACRPERAYANAKLAVLMFSHELERRLRQSSNSEGVTSHAVNPNAVTSDFLLKGGPDTSQPGFNYYSVASYFPPVWIARKIFGFLYTRMGTALTRTVEHGAKSVFHVATSEALAAAGGGLFDDTESAFTKCGRPAHRCGRVSRQWEPPVVHDGQASRRLWEISEELVATEANKR